MFDLLEGVEDSLSPFNHKEVAGIKDFCLENSSRLLGRGVVDRHCLRAPHILLQREVFHVRLPFSNNHHEKGPNGSKNRPRPARSLLHYALNPKYS